MATKRKRKPTRPKAGAPCKLDDKVQKKLCSLLTIGMYLEPAAASCGLHKDTVYKWLKAGERGEGYENHSAARMRAFSDAVQKALGDFEALALKQIYEAGDAGDWHATAWRLERKHPDRWGRRTGLDITSGGEKVTPVHVISFRDDIAELTGGDDDDET